MSYVKKYTYIYTRPTKSGKLRTYVCNYNKTVNSERRGHGLQYIEPSIREAVLELYKDFKDINLIYRCYIAKYGKKLSKYLIKRIINEST